MILTLGHIFKIHQVYRERGTRFLEMKTTFLSDKIDLCGKDTFGASWKDKLMGVDELKICPSEKVLDQKIFVLDF